jgi:ribosome recycling factor
MMSEAKKIATDGMTQALEHLTVELKNIRTGRANPGLVEGVLVEVYGSQMRLKDIANITMPELRQLLITPYDGNNAGAIRKGIELANLGLNPILEGGTVRITIASMDESQRKDMVKLSHKRREDCKISIRNARRDGNDFARKQKNDGDISEDLLKNEEKSIQDLTDEYCKKADELTAVKEKEVMTI